MIDMTELINSIPESVRTLYHINTPCDFSNEKGIHTADFDYYPQLNCVVIDGIILFWDDDMPYVKPNIPEHLAALKERISARRFHSIGIIHRMKNDPENKLYCLLKPDNTDISGLERIAFDDTWIYYNPKEVDMQDNLTRNLAKVLFATQRYDAEYILPSKDKNPANWEG